MKLFDRLRLGLYSVMFAGLALTCGAILTTPADAAPPDIGIGCTYTDAGTAQTKACIGIFAGGAGDSNGLNVQGNSPAGVADTGMPVKVGGVFNATAPILSTGQRADLQLTARGNVLTTLTDGTNGIVNSQNYTSDVASATAQALRVTAFNYNFDGTNVVRTRGNTDGTAVIEAATASGTFAASYSASPSVEAARVAKAGPGNLYGFTVTTGASPGYVMVINVVGAPADGAVLPASCFAIAANATMDKTYPVPLYLPTGITFVFSTTGCFTKTASATAFFSVLYK